MDSGVEKIDICREFGYVMGLWIIDSQPIVHFRLDSLSIGLGLGKGFLQRQTCRLDERIAGIDLGKQNYVGSQRQMLS